MDEKERGFTVTDKRGAAHQQAETPQPPKQEMPPQEPPQAQAGGFPEDGEFMPLPEASFITLIFSLYTHAQITLGVIPDPMTQQWMKDVEQAKYNIDLLGMLQEKTRGNLTDEEQRTLEQMLYDVRMAYIGTGASK